jgi:enterochelin esterase-like enzyme
VGYAVYHPPGDGAPFPEAQGADGVARRYPVVYWLHGMGGGPWRGARFVERFDQAIREGLIPPAIAVLPTGARAACTPTPGTARGRWRRCWCGS